VDTGRALPPVAAKNESHEAVRPPAESLQQRVSMPVGADQRQTSSKMPGCHAAGRRQPAAAPEQRKQVRGSKVSRVSLMPPGCTGEEVGSGLSTMS